MTRFIPAAEADPGQGFRLAHISDPHLSTLDGVPWRQLLNKRLLGYLSWRFNRRHHHRPALLDRLVEDLNGHHAHHLLISGDMTHLGTAMECRQVENWLSRLGSPGDISVIPGNHDSYIREEVSRTTGLWSAYMAGDTSEDKAGGAVVFPSLRKRGPLAIIGLSTALPTAPFFATGKLGENQLQKLSDTLEQTGKEGLFRVVALHHGPLPDSNRYRKRLVDAEAFRAVIRSAGAELIVHGHGHYPDCGSIKSPGLQVPVIGAASASLLSASTVKRAGYNIYQVNAMDGHWNIHLVSRTYDPEAGVFRQRQQLDFGLPQAQPCA